MTCRTARCTNLTCNCRAHSLSRSAAVHCPKAIQHLTEPAGRIDVGSTNHRGIAYAALAANDIIGKLRYLAVYIETDEDIPSIGAKANRITASILSGEPVDDDRKFAPPGEDDECTVKRELTTGKTTYGCAPPDPPEDRDVDDLCTTFPAGSAP